MTTYADVLTYITNVFYNPDERVKVSINNFNENSYDNSTITLSQNLIDKFRQLKLPGFVVYYHELGHHLYTKPMFKLLEKWQSIPGDTPLSWKQKYHHLLNWIEDYYIEDKLIQQYPYMHDVLTALKKIPPEYDITDIKYAFNYFYLYRKASPALKRPQEFLNYIQTLYQLRIAANFGNNVISNITLKQFSDTEFVKNVIAFYEWCVVEGIFDPDKTMPPLMHPSNRLIDKNDVDQIKKVLESVKEKNMQSTDTTQPTQPIQPTNEQGDNPKEPTIDITIDNIQEVLKGNHSDFIKHLGKGFVETTHIHRSTDTFLEEFSQEQKLIKTMLQDIHEQHTGYTDTLSGILQPRYKQTNLIQNKVEITNFFNPNRLVDQYLFLEHEHTYMNVALYRDVSGSTRGYVHNLMHQVCEHLMEHMTVDVNYYLYSSGEVSIVEATYIPWEQSSDMPKEYKLSEDIMKLGGGTNSAAIADVITEQYNDTWLNIIVTDGDLTQLMQRTNINVLLKNVFVIFVTDNPLTKEHTENVSNYMLIQEDTDIKNLISTLSLMEKGV
jgi:hypothetical protein